MKKRLPVLLTALLMSSGCAKPEPPKTAEAVNLELAEREPTGLFWGDTHLHTNYSPDAYFFGNASADPDTAHRWAKGEPVAHPYTKSKVRIGTPLDFLVVADHAEMMGVPLRLFSGDEELAKTASGKRFIKMMEQGKNQDIFFDFITAINDNEPFDDLNTGELRESLWAEHIDYSERHNVPGEFTSLIGWEWTSTPDGKNLHRVVFMPEGASVAKNFIPYSAFDSSKPEDLWAWLDRTSKETGASFLAIPHNPNISGGLMFDSVDSEGRPITADYARTRMRWEPVVEIVQIKGDSETHPALSPNDELAGFEPFGHMIDTAEIKSGQASAPKADAGDYVRSGLKRGLEIERATGVNPYKVGVIGSTDSHTGLASAEEDNFWGKTAFDSTPENTFATFLDIPNFGADMSAAGLAAVWAEANTREALFEAFRRREVYASSGPRIRLRFFGGWGFSEDDAKAKNMAAVGYGKGVPMGGDLTEAPKGRAPEFLVYAVKDPKGANLDRVQIVKGWVGNDGVANEKVYEVVWSDDREQQDDGSIRALQSTVDLTTGQYRDDIGATQLSTRWRDPDFDPAQRAFYYVRVLQIPTPRHTLYDAIALQMDPEKTGHPSVIQERAYSSPIWYTP